MRAQEENHMMYDPKLQEILDSTGFLHKWEMKAYIQAIQNRLLDDESILFAYPSNIGFYSLTEKRILFYDKKSGITEMPISSILGIEEKGGKIEFIKVSEGYSPIEIYSEKIKIDERSDVYSLMAILYFMFCGKKVNGVIERFYKPELEFEREVILGFEKIEKFKKMEEVIKKGLEYEREKRFGSVKEMVEEIKKFEPKVLKNCK